MAHLGKLMLNATSQTSERKDREAWLMIGGFALLVSLLLLVRGGRLLIPLFPLGALTVALFLYLRTPILYVGFTWWMWFLCPVIRRIIDYQSGYLTPGPWTLTSTLVTFVSVLSLIRYFPKANRLGGLPFVICAGAVFYGLLMGLIQNSKSSTILSFLSWFNPIAFGFHLYLYWPEYPRYRQMMLRTFLWGILLMGIYGIYQYWVAPDWDRFWLRNITATSFGKPEPFGIRVCSTMDAPQTFGAMASAGLLLLLADPGGWQILAMGLGYLTFLLSSARSAWLSWIVGFLIYVPFLKPYLQMRLVTTTLIVALLVVPAINIEPFSTMIAPRLESISNTNDDTSYQARTQGYRELLNSAISEGFGRGLGFQITGASIGSRDSGILTMLFSLGWLGTIPYMMGICLMFLQLFQGTAIQEDAFASASRAIALSTFLQISLNVVTEGTFAIILWGFLAMAMAAQRYYAVKTQPLIHS